MRYVPAVLFAAPLYEEIPNRIAGRNKGHIMFERMKGTLKCIFLICIFCVCMTACGSDETADAGYTDRTQLVIPMPEEIAESTSYSYTKIGDVEYEITLYDKVHNEVCSGVYSEVSWVKMITDTYTLILTDIFKKGILHQEIVRDFSFRVIADSMSVVTSVEMIDEKPSD